MYSASDRVTGIGVDVQSETTPGELTGLTSLAFHPDFARNGRYFLKMHGPRGPGLPAVQVKSAMSLIEDGAMITVDGETGRVTLNEVATA